MSLLLLDTSAWIEFLRDTGSPACVRVHELLREDLASVVTTPPVVMELLAGGRDERSTAALERLTSGLRSLDLAPATDFHAAAAAYRACRQRGTTVRGLVDCLIAVVAQRHRAVLVHRDADLAVLAAALSSAQQDLRPATA